MSTSPTGPSVVKEFQFFTESKRVVVVLEDESSQEFAGHENYHAAASAAHHAPERPTFDLELTNEKGETLHFVVKQDVGHETFAA